MISHENITKAIGAVMAICVTLCILAMVFSQKVVEVFGSSMIEMQYETMLFDTDTPIQIDILMEEESWEEMLDKASAEEYYTCDTVINGLKICNVGIRPKGNTSLTAIAMDPETDRFSLKLKFDHYVEGQTCFGLDKLILNNNYADATNMKEAVVYDMYEYLDVDASLYHYAQISVNGEYWGVYLALEAVEESFLLRNYGTEDGALYKPESMKMGGRFKGDEKLEGGLPQFDSEKFSDADEEQKPEDKGLSDADEEQKPEDKGLSDADEEQKSEGKGFPDADEEQKSEGKGFPDADEEQKPEDKGLSDADEEQKSEGKGFPDADEEQKSEGKGFPDGNEMKEAGLKEFRGKNRPVQGSEEFKGGPPGQGGGFGMGGNGADLNYSDDNLDSYSAIWEGEVTSTGKQDHRRVVTALKNISEGTDLEEYMDVDNILKYMAVHTFSVNLDSLSGNMAHNYYLYEHDGMLNILPWDYNLSFGGMNAGPDSSAFEMVNDAIDSPFQMTVFFDALLEDEDYLARYHGYLEKLTKEYVLGGRFEEVFKRIRGQIDVLVESDPTALYSYEEYETGTAMLYQTVMLRAESIKGQLEGTIPSTDEGQRMDSQNLVDASTIDIAAMGVFDMAGGFHAPDAR